ncbi:MAG: DUF3999 family protein [Planctomycetota bacterium]
MRKTRIVAVAVLLTGAAGSVFAFDPVKWKYQAPVTVEAGASRYCRLSLTPEVYDAARLDLGDIRLVAPNGEQIPYVLARPKDSTSKLKFRPAVINRSTDIRGASAVTLDFGQHVIKNSIEVETKGGNFRRAVRVEGSNDNVEFFALVKQAYVFAVGQGRRFSKVDLPSNDYRYLRVRVEPMHGQEEDVVITQVQTYRLEKKFAERQPVKMVLAEHKQDKKRNLSIYVYDLVSRHLPIRDIELDVADDSFYRFISVEGRDAATRKVKLDSEDNRERFTEVEVPWRSIMSGAIYRYTTGGGKPREKLLLHVPSGRSTYRYLRLAISNYDDRPIAVKSASAKMIAHELIFEPGNTEAAVLYVGSPSANKPRYDLARRLSQPLQVRARGARVNRVAPNPSFGPTQVRPVAWTEKHRVLLVVVLGASVLVLGWFILKSFKSIRSEQTQNRHPEEG